MPGTLTDRNPAQPGAPAHELLVGDEASRGLAGPPGPHTPGIFNALRFSRDPIGFLAGMRKRYGPVVSFRMPSFGGLNYISDLADIKQVFAGDPTVFHAGEANASVLEPALGPYSVLSLDEGPHMQQRRLLLPPFHGENVRTYAAEVRQIAHRHIDGWPLGEPISLHRRAELITLDVILGTVFGVHDAERSERAQRLIDTFARRAHPILLFPALRRNFGPRSPWVRFMRARAELDEFLYEQIELRRREASGDGGNDILALLLSARHEDASPMSDQELRDELITVLGAGFETTATALAWSAERLVHNPRVMRKLVDSLGEGDEYLDAVANEVLRMRPPIMEVGRKLTQPVAVGGYRLERGSFVIPSILTTHFREDIYGDPYEFRPERFLVDDLPGAAWFPFGGGIRRCIGAAFAQMEMRVVLRVMLETLELSAVDERPERTRIRRITLAPAKGARVMVTRR